ncbi:MAG: matrixin family metalloprotease [Planctomycetaceae bacterium]
MNRFREFLYAAFVLACASISANADLIDNVDLSEHPEEFALNGRKWNPGPNAAENFTTAGPGSATFSIMGAGLDFDPIVSAADPDHVGLTQSILDLDVPTFTTVADYAAVIDWALDVWDSVSGFTNLGLVGDGHVSAGAPESSGGHFGDIRIAAWEISTSNVLAHAFRPGTEGLVGAGGTVLGDMHIDVNRTWVDDPTDTNSDADIDIYTVVLHEIGHSLGLSHSALATAVMHASYGGAKRTLTADDIAGIQAIYGPADAVPEPSSFILLGLGSLSVVLFRRTRRGSRRTAPTAQA